jgi:hypothetical protein
MPKYVFCFILFTFVSSISVSGSDNDRGPTIKDFQKCRECQAPFDGTPHVADYKQCSKCNAALTKAMGYLKKNFKPEYFGYLLDSFYAGFVFLMDEKGGHEKELETCVKNCRDLIHSKEDNSFGNSAGKYSLASGWSSWKKSMAMYFLTEYSLQHGLTPETKAALIAGAKYATETVQPNGGWFHSAPQPNQYSADIAIIGCIYYAAFLQMETLGLEPGPILEQTRAYLEKASDGKTIGYRYDWKGGMKGGGHNGFVLMGMLGSGNGDDKWGAGLAAYIKENYAMAAHGHANGELHYFAVGAALHRLGHEAYARFATCHVHRLIEIQKEDGSIPKLPNDMSEIEWYKQAKTSTEPRDSYSATAVLAALILMEKPSAFSPLPSKKPGSMSNKEAFKIASEAMEKYDYARAFKHFAMVLPRGDSGELIPTAREHMRKIELEAKNQYLGAQERSSKLIKPFGADEDSREGLQAYAAAIKELEKFCADFEGTAAAGDSRQAIVTLQKTLSEKRQRLAFRGPSGTAAAKTMAAGSPKEGPGTLQDAGQHAHWDAKLKERTQAAVSSGEKPRFLFKALSTRVTVISIADDGAMKVALEKGGQMDMNLTKLAAADKASLATDFIAKGERPADYALAAYFLLSVGDTARVQDYLIKSGEDGKKVREAFGMN